MPIQFSPLVDSRIGLADPSEEIRKNLETYSAITTAQQNQQIVVQRAHDLQRKEAAAQALQADVDAFAGNMTMAGALELVGRHPAMSEDVKRITDMMDAKDKKALVNQILPIANALATGNLGTALKRAETLASALDNSGRSEDAKALRAKIDVMQTNGPLALVDFSSTLSAAMGEKDFGSWSASLGLTDKLREDKAKANKAVFDEQKAGVDARLEERKVKADIHQSEKAGDASAASVIHSSEQTKDIIAQRPLKMEGLRLGNLGLEADALTKADTLLAEPAKRAQAAKESEARIADHYNQIAKRGTDATRELQDSSVTNKKRMAEIDDLERKSGALSDSMAKESLSLAETARTLSQEAGVARRVQAEYSKIPEGPRSSGVIADLEEKWKRFSGNEDKMTEIRKIAESVFVRDLADRAAKLKPVSDKDMAILQGPLPSVTSSVQYVAKYMGALARAKEQQAEGAAIQAAWITTIGDPRNAPKDMVVRGEKVRKGTSMAEFMNNPHGSLTDEEVLRGVPGKYKVAK